MKKINFYNLVLEVTRKCNMRCDHCCRGDAEDLNIPNQIIDAVLEQTDYIISVTFTGGEPTLNMDSIEYFYKRAKKLKVDIGNFYLVTNGKVISERLAVILLRLYSYCSDNKISSLCISKTKYHWPEGYPNKRTIYDGLSFFNPDDRKELSNRAVIIEGRALDYGIGYRTIKPEEISIEDYDDNILQEISIEDYDDNILHVENTIYINCKGDIITNCDFSYESQEEYKIGNVLDPKRNISHIIEEQARKEEKEGE